ncbi:MAG: Smr/MutS family protein [Candidatus Latescibacteria bacterium]|jgi:DNA-nicking Smr family endonuclease|nr:Smr/MutS family protein [Candidatus Latescibacterota bacterium]
MESELFDYPVDGTLDLHMFKPGDVKSALSEFLLQCRIQGVLYVRIIHGKGHGVLRQIVQSHLKKCNFIRDFRTAPDASSWGATIAILEPMGKEGEKSGT